MSTPQPNNINATDLSGNIPNETDFFFSNYFSPAFTVSQNIDDAVLAFFEKITQNKESAKVLASSVIYISLARDIDPMETLANFSSLDEGQLNSYVTAFLNLNRTGTSYLGINGVPRVGKYVQRMIMP
jgi:hypothetical protein